LELIELTIKTFAAAAALLATAGMASAADMAVKARPVLPAPVWTWTGFYIGAHVGAGWGETESTLTGINVGPPAGPLAATFAVPFNQNSRSGFLGGVQAGYNWQSGWAVFGVQGDFAGADIKGTTPCALIAILTCTSKTDWLATVSGRLGAVVLDRGLVYVKGGAAWMNTNHSVSFPNFGPGGGLINNLNVVNKDSNTWGWLVGFGTEWQITPNWTAFVEYNYIEFDKQNEGFGLNPTISAAVLGGSPVTINADIKNTLSIAKVGVNYKFDWGSPVVARY
jgi:outer membrane immunogenic protein